MARMRVQRDVGQMAPYALLAISTLAAFVLIGVAPELFSPSAAPWFVALAALAAAIRLRGSRPGATPARVRIAFWSGVAVTLGLVVASPAFVLYAFIGYPDATRHLRGREGVAGVLVVAGVCALAQTGGVNSAILTPGVWLLFWIVNLVVAVSMASLDRQRQRTADALAVANAELRTAQARTEALQQQLLTQAREAGITEERARLAREIHDTIAQDLVAVIAQLGGAADTLDSLSTDATFDALTTRDTLDATHTGGAARASTVTRSAPAHLSTARERLERAEHTARGALGEARRAVEALSSPRLDADDLPAAIERLLESWQVASGATARLVTHGQVRWTGHDDVALRIVQEALANIARHAAATCATVILTYGSDDLAVEISDDGRGFDVSAEADGHGLPGMRERATGAGGGWSITSTPGVGTTVNARLPGAGA